MAKLPRSIEAQGKRADELLKKLAAQNPPGAAPEPGITDPSAPPPPANDPPAPSVTDPLSAPLTPPAIEPPPATPASPGACQECEKWKHKYSVLQGKYDAEVPRLTYRVSFLENQIDDLERKGPQATPPATPPSETTGTVPQTTTTVGFFDTLKNSNDEVIKNFRDNFPDVFAGVGKLFDDYGGQLLKKTEDRLTAIEKTTSETKQGAFLRELSQAHADWQTLCQTNPNWPVWLSRPDRYGRKALDVLKEAQANLNSAVVINLLADFKEEMGNAPAPQPRTPAPQNPNAQFVTPPSGSSQGAGNITPQGSVEPVTRSFINQYYQDKAKGRYRGKEAEVAAIEAKINAALAQNLVIAK